MISRRVGLVVLAVMVLAMPGAAQADPRQVFLGAPFDRASASRDCVDAFALAGDCVTFAASADADTGVFDLELHQRTRDEGSSVGASIGRADAEFTSTSTRSEPTQAVLAVATFAFDELLADRSGVLPLVAPVDIWIDVFLHHETCDDCVAHGATVLVDDGPSFEAPPSASALAVMTRPSGEPIPPGVIHVTGRINILTALAGIGELRATARGALQHIELATPSLERVASAPYLDARAGRGCDGSLGTTFECRAAAAATTGRVEMDLDVISPVAGTAPGSGSAVGDASIGLVDVPSEPVRARVFVADLDVDSAEAFVNAATPVIGRAEASLTSSLWVSGPCQTCSSGAGATIADALAGPGSRLDDTLHMAVWTRELSNIAAADEAAVTFGVSGVSVLQHSSGIATSLVRSRLARVRVFEIA